MPCWFYDKKDLINTPSSRDGISSETEAWYRKEGAKHIMDAGNKLGLRFDTCATGVVYFHRFYMFHSFKEFHRLVTAACCLFLAGKVEETPKKCKDIIKTFRSMLNDTQFAHFGEDPKEEVMTLERILLQTIKFDLMVEHPYAYLLKFAKLVKGDKAKIQKMVQMAWTFINDSLCTTLCLQWEPEIVAVAVMYLTSRLNKFDISDWQGKPLGYRGKWYEFLVEDVTLELLEDICHQVLDLYSNAPQPQKDTSNSPVPVRVRQPPLSSDDDQSRTPRTPKSPHGVKRPAPSTVSGTAQSAESDVLPPAAKERDRVTTHTESQSSSSRPIGAYPSHQGTSSAVPAAAAAAAPTAAPAAAVPTTSAYSLANPYMSTQMYSSSFMSTEGSQSIQSLMGTQAASAASRDEHGTATQPQQGRPSSYSTLSAAYQQPFPVGHQQYASTAGQGSSAAGTSAGTHRSEYSGGSGAAAAGSYRASSSASFGQQSQQYSAYQQPPAQASQQASTEGAAGYPGAAFMTASGQPQYPASAAASAQSTSPAYQNYGGSRSGASAYGAQTTASGSQQQQQRYQTNQPQPVVSASYQSHSVPSSGFQSQSTSGSAYHSQQSSSAAAYQSHSTGGYQSRAPSAAAYSSQQPSNAATGYQQSNQSGYSGREQSGGSGYHGQPSSGSGRSGASGSQQQSGSSSRGQNWGY